MTRLSSPRPLVGHRKLVSMSTAVTLFWFSSCEGPRKEARRTDIFCSAYLSSRLVLTGQEITPVRWARKRSSRNLAHSKKSGIHSCAPQKQSDQDHYCPLSHANSRLPTAPCCACEMVVTSIPFLAVLATRFFSPSLRSRLVLLSSAASGEARNSVFRGSPRKPVPFVPRFLRQFGRPTVSSGASADFPRRSFPASFLRLCSVLLLPAVREASLRRPP